MSCLGGDSNNGKHYYGLMNKPFYRVIRRFVIGGFITTLCVSSLFVIVYLTNLILNHINLEQIAYGCMGILFIWIIYNVGKTILGE